MQDLDKQKIPRHIAIVMDGNGRWAAKRGLPKLAGHNAGMQAMKEIVKRSSVLGVGYLTVYAFSTENWKRSSEEVSGIFKLLIKYVDKELDELNDNNVIVKIIGNYQKLPAEAVKSVEKAIKATATNNGLQFNIALNYGSRAEITSAVQKIANEVVEKKISIDEIDESKIDSCLFTAGIPDPDMVIRTSGEKRLSNYLLWQSAYSEFVFREELWPDFTPEIYEEAIKEYQDRERRYGGR